MNDRPKRVLRLPLQLLSGDTVNTENSIKSEEENFKLDLGLALPQSKSLYETRRTCSMKFARFSFSRHLMMPSNRLEVVGVTLKKR